MKFILTCLDACAPSIKLVLRDDLLDNAEAYLLQVIVVDVELVHLRAADALSSARIKEEERDAMRHIA